ncbi:MAG: 16S rRNA (cytosine(1402)-N(4))-methyltransferase RsmH [Planctomycetota bacterium]
MTPDQHRQSLPRHRPVMVEEVLQVLEPSAGERALDLTLGRGGHAEPIARALGKDGLLAGVDADREVLQATKEALREKASCRCRFFHGRFSSAPDLTDRLGLSGFDVVLADLGVGSHQLDDPERGFAFDSDHPLDMRYDTDRGPTARQVVNSTPEEELADIFYELGEERYSRQIAAEICRVREEEEIQTPSELAGIVKRVYARRSSGRTWRIHPATRVMMALRIHVNRELDELTTLLEELPDLLNAGGRVAILTYHSLEARRVKHVWREQEAKELLEVITETPLMPSEEEIGENPRARSAQLRAARRRSVGLREG